MPPLDPRCKTPPHRYQHLPLDAFERARLLSEWCYRSLFIPHDHMFYEIDQRACIFVTAAKGIQPQHNVTHIMDPVNESGLGLHLLRMFCLFLGLSLSLFSRRKRSISGCSVGASLPPSENGWPSSPSWIITLSSSLPLVSGYPCRTARSARSPLAHPNKGGQNQKSKPLLGVTMMPLGAPSISKYGSLVRRDAQIVALRAHCTRTALKAPPLTMGSQLLNHWFPSPHGCSPPNVFKDGIRTLPDTLHNSKPRRSHFFRIK